MPRGRRPLHRSLLSPLRASLPRSRRARVAGATGAAVLTATAVGIGVLAPAPASTPASTSASTSAPQAQGSLADAAAVAELTDEERSIGTSRSVVRRPALEPRVPKVEKKLWTTAPLKLRVQPREQARDRGTFPDDERIGVTGERKNGYAQVVVEGQARWVTAEYLSKEKQEEPETGAAAGVNTGPCANGAVASGGLQPRAQTVMNAVCNAFPDITTYGGAAGRGEHGTGLAIDIMVSGARGEQVKQFLYANAAQFGLSNIIWAQTIWSAQRGGEGFRGMENRGSSTANHFDHVHVLVG